MGTQSILYYPYIGSRGLFGPKKVFKNCLKLVGYGMFCLFEQNLPVQLNKTCPITIILGVSGS